MSLNLVKNSYSKPKQNTETNDNDNNQNLLTKMSYTDLGKPLLSTKNKKIEKISNVYSGNSKFSNSSQKASASPYRTASANNKISKL